MCFTKIRNGVAVEISICDNVMIEALPYTLLTGLCMRFCGSQSGTRLWFSLTFFETSHASYVQPLLHTRPMKHAVVLANTFSCTLYLNWGL
jgi:hypothetical protein